MELRTQLGSGLDMTGRARTLSMKGPRWSGLRDFLVSSLSQKVAHRGNPILFLLREQYVALCIKVTDNIKDLLKLLRC